MLVCAGILTVIPLKQSFRVPWGPGSHLTPIATTMHISAVTIPSLSLMICTFIQAGMPPSCPGQRSLNFPT